MNLLLQTVYVNATNLNKTWLLILIYSIIKNKFYWRFWVRKFTINYLQLPLSIPKCRILGIHLRQYKELYRLFQITWYCCNHFSVHTVEPFFSKSLTNTVHLPSYCLLFNLKLLTASGIQLGAIIRMLTCHLFLEKIFLLWAPHLHVIYSDFIRGNIEKY